MVFLTSHTLTNSQNDLEIVSLDWIFFFFFAVFNAHSRRAVGSIPRDSQDVN